MRRKSVAEEYPELVPQWGTINDLSPDKVSSGSHKKVWWVCEKGHTWEAVIKNRTHKGSGCPYCEHRAVLTGFNDLQTLFPDVAATWSPNNQLKPSEVSSMSSFEALWVCGNGHEWRSRVADRAKGHGCPYCAGQRVWKGFNDLATTHPLLVNEWSDKNENLSPEEITYKNRSNVWWHCNKCGSQTVSLEWFSQKYSNNKWALRDPFSFAKLKGHLNLVLRQPPFFRLFSYRSQIRNLLQYRSNNI